MTISTVCSPPFLHIFSARADKPSIVKVLLLINLLTIEEFS